MELTSDTCIIDGEHFFITMAHFRVDALRSLIQVEPTDHPLAVAQRERITPDEARQIVHFYTDG